MTGRPTSLQATALPWQPTCRFCNALIDRHEAVRSGVCSARSCQTRRIQEAAALVRERRWQAHVARWQTHITSLCQIIETHGSEIDAAAAELGGDPAEIAYGLVPRQDRPLSSLPDERRVDFGTRVNQVVTAAFAEEAPKSPTDRGGEEPRAPLMSAACATCAGQCCTLGAASHAFLTVDTIQRFRHEHPGMTEADVTAHYLDRLPEHSVEGSCVYHGDQGCALPRTERSDVCNDYHCGPQIQLGQHFSEMGATKALIVSCDGATTPAIGFHESGHGWRRFPMMAAPDATPPPRSAAPPISTAVARTIAAAISLTPPPIT